MKESSLIHALRLNGRGVISLMGAGGKTTLMFQLAKALQEIGKKVLTTTTTKIFMPPPKQTEAVILSADMEFLLGQLKTECRHMRHVTMGVSLIKGSAGSSVGMRGDKILGFSGEAVDQLWQSGCFDWIIVEADGAKRKSLKACNAAEPVIPDCTECLILVAGLDVLGHSLCDDYVHRALLFSRNSGLPLGAPLNAIHMARGLAVEMEKIDLVQPGALKYVVLNKADSPQLEMEGTVVAKYLSECGVCCGIMVAALEAVLPVKQWYEIK
ncbi:selenium cofactor biosynthesis protein YqeC [Desulfocicer niacini]